MPKRPAAARLSHAHLKALRYYCQLRKPKSIIMFMASGPVPHCICSSTGDQEMVAPIVLPRLDEDGNVIAVLADWFQLENIPVL